MLIRNNLPTPPCCPGAHRSRPNGTEQDGDYLKHICFDQHTKCSDAQPLPPPADRTPTITFNRAGQACRARRPSSGKAPVQLSAGGAAPAAAVVRTRKSRDGQPVVCCACSPCYGRQCMPTRSLWRREPPTKGVSCWSPGRGVNHLNPVQPDSACTEPSPPLARAHPLCATAMLASG